MITRHSFRVAFWMMAAAMVLPTLIALAIKSDLEGLIITLWVSGFVLACIAGNTVMQDPFDPFRTRLDPTEELLGISFAAGFFLFTVIAGCSHFLWPDVSTAMVTLSISVIIYPTCAIIEGATAIIRASKIPASRELL